MAALAGALIADPEFVQFHPTAIDLGLDPAPLATEALRGEGARLVNGDGAPFMGRYDPRGRPGSARRGGPRRQRRAGGRPRRLPRRPHRRSARISRRFPAVFAACMAAGVRSPHPADPRGAGGALSHGRGLDGPATAAPPCPASMRGRRMRLHRRPRGEPAGLQLPAGSGGLRRPRRRVPPHKRRRTTAISCPPSRRPPYPTPRLSNSATPWTATRAWCATRLACVVCWARSANSNACTERRSHWSPLVWSPRRRWRAARAAAPISAPTSRRLPSLSGRMRTLARGSLDGAQNEPRTAALARPPDRAGGPRRPGRGSRPCGRHHRRRLIDADARLDADLRGAQAGPYRGHGLRCAWPSAALDPAARFEVAGRRRRVDPRARRGYCARRGQRPGPAHRPSVSR